MTIAITQPSSTRRHRPSFTLYTFVPDGAHDTRCNESCRLKTPVITATARESQLLPILPPELHLEIIDIVSSRVPRSPCRDEHYDPADLATLRACALVCKLWLHTARIGIWTGVRLADTKRSVALLRLLHPYARAPGDSLPALTIPSLGRYVAHLSIRETRGNSWDPKWLDDALPHLALHLPRIQHLEMEHITWEYLSSRSRTACMEAFKHAKCLTLRGFVFHTTRDMYNFLGEFTELETLTLDGVHCAKRNTPTWCFGSEVDGDMAINPPSRRLSEVGFRRLPMEAVMEWIMAGSQYHQQLGRPGLAIKSIRLGGVGVSEANVVGRFLRGAGDKLKKVYIGFDTGFVERGDVLVREIELAENTNLEEFHIFGLVVPSPALVDPFTHEPTEPHPALEALTSLLSQIQSRMQILSLAMYPADLRAMSAIDFEGLNAVFERRVWSHLNELRVVISNKGYGFGNVARERLRTVQERGVLKVNVGFDEREVL